VDCQERLLFSFTSRSAALSSAFRTMSGHPRTAVIRPSHIAGGKHEKAPSGHAADIADQLLGAMSRDRPPRSSRFT